MTAFPVISQNAADSVKVSRLDLISAAEELEELDQLKAESVVLFNIMETYKKENIALQLQNSAKAAQIELLNRAYNILETQNEAQEEQKRRKFGFTEALVILTAFLAGSFVTAL